MRSSNRGAKRRFNSGPGCGHNVVQLVSRTDERWSKIKSSSPVGWANNHTVLSGYALNYSTEFRMHKLTRIHRITKIHRKHEAHGPDVPYARQFTGSGPELLCKIVAVGGHLLQQPIMLNRFQAGDCGSTGWR